MIDIRPAILCDSPQLAEIYAPYCATPISFEAQAPDAGQMEERLRGLWPTHPWLVAQAGEQLLGYAYAGPHRQRQAYDWTVESSVYLRPEARGQGLGRRLYQELLALLQRQGFRTVLAGLTLPNPASEALHRQLGFQDVGIFPAVGFKAGQWRSVLWLAQHFSQPDPPAAPLWLPEVGAGDWQRPSLNSPRLRLEPLGPGHEQALLDYITRERARLQAGFPVMTKVVSNLESARHYVRGKLQEWFRRQSYAFAIQQDGQLIGTLTLKHFDWSVPKADAGYSLAEAWEGQGLASEALQTVLPFARQLGLRRLFLRIHPDNRGSQRVAEKSGFQREGLLRHDFVDGHGQPQDVFYYSVTF